MPRTTRRLVQLATVSILLGAGCGPFGYLKKVAKEANQSVADAKAAGAEEWAPYEYWGAVSYLEQSKVMMAYSEYERSFDYGERAKALAAEAKKKTDMREAGETEESDPNIARPEDDIGEQPADGAAKVETRSEGEAPGGEVKGKAGVKVGGDK